MLKNIVNRSVLWCGATSDLDFPVSKYYQLRFFTL